MSRRRFFGTIAVAVATAKIPAILQAAARTAPVVNVIPKPFYCSIAIPDYILKIQRTHNDMGNALLREMQEASKYMEEYREPRRLRPSSDVGC